LGIFGILIFLSPPIELILERANLDVLIFILVIASALLFANKRIVSSVFLLAICSLMKFYTLPLLILVSIFSASGIKRFKFLQLYLVPMLVICVVDIYRVPFFPWDARNMFGLPIYGEYLSFALQGPNSHSNRIFATSLGLIIFALITFSIIKLSKRFSIFPSEIYTEISRNQLAIFFFSFTVFLSCFLAGLNIDYRLIFLAIPALVFLGLNLSKGLILSLCLFLFISMFTSYNTYLLQPIGDVFLMVVTCYFTIFVWKEREVFLDLLKPGLKSH
jgi:hypothetical protein